VLGNPTAYQVVKLLTKEQQTPSAIAEKLRLFLSRISTVLRHLRQIDIVRYENLREGKVYFIKDEAVVSILSLLENSVERLKTREYQVFWA